MTDDPIIDVTIRELAAGGDGVARTDDGAIFVPLTAPGDEVRVRVTERRKRWARGEVVELRQPGPDRREAPCPLADRCGGCQWQQVTEAAQLAAKQSILQRALRQVGLDALTPTEPLAAPAALGYRCRARLDWQCMAGQEPRLGFRASRSHELVDVPACPVLLPDLSARLGALHRALPPPPSEGELLLLGNGRQAAAAFQSPDLGVPPASGPMREALDAGLDGGLAGDPRHWERAASWGAPRIIFDADDPRPLQLTPELFAQANPAANALLREQVRSWLTRLPDAPAGPILELFAGAGNFTRELATRAEVVAVESSRPAVALAKKSLEGLPVSWRAQHVDHALSQLINEGLHPAAVLLDPPRVGAKGIAPMLGKLAAPELLYVSCDAATLARDLAALTAEGYALRHIRLTDSMPQTAHFETLASLTLAR